MDPLYNKLLNMSLVSSRMDDIMIERKKGKNLGLRPTLHVMQVSNFGSLKTTLAKRIELYCNKMKWPVRYLNDYTYASLAGSVEKKGEVMPPACVEVIGGTLIVDEFAISPTEKMQVLKSINSIVEDEKSYRGISRAISKKSQKEMKERYGDHFRVKGSGFEWFNLRTNWIFLTASDPLMSQNKELHMLASRCVPVFFNPSLDDLNTIDDDPSLYFTPMKLPSTKQRTIQSVEYLPIRAKVYEWFTKEKLDSHYYFRTIDDLMRIYVINGHRRDEELENFILERKIKFAKRTKALETAIDLHVEVWEP